MNSAFLCGESQRIDEAAGIGREQNVPAASEKMFKVGLK